LASLRVSASASCAKVCRLSHGAKKIMADIIKSKTKKGYDRYRASSPEGEEWMKTHYDRETEVTMKKPKQVDALELAAKAARLTISQEKSK
jgi:hypothetical protein